MESAAVEATFTARCDVAAVEEMKAEAVRTLERMRPGGLEVVDVYLAFRRAFLRRRDVRIFTRGELPGPVTVCIVRERGRVTDFGMQWTVPAQMMARGSLRDLQRAAYGVLPPFARTESCRRKVRYATMEDAEAKLLELLALSLKHGRRGQESQAYECPVCGQWHLTSSTKRAR